LSFSNRPSSSDAANAAAPFAAIRCAIRAAAAIRCATSAAASVRALIAQPFEVVDHEVEALAVDHLHRVVDVLAVLADVEDRHDVGVVHPRGGLRLALKAHERFGIAGERRGEHLERHAAAERFLLRLVNHAHAAAADLAQDAVVADVHQPLAVEPDAVASEPLSSKTTGLRS